ncbi:MULTISPECIES: AAA family ATPase [Actinomadura]|uniref:Nuclease SbcCD subunit C n=1 Tax=Actinomadura yumaensis TaxID=111807 RepID=A0ABW2CK35_9ACTN|nr:AAA family ATPase [Actinomadura sp. J1-007]MWK38691.1 AAA family ATPase [Actinomadura sp. J1-007]
MALRDTLVTLLEESALADEARRHVMAAFDGGETEEAESPRAATAGRVFLKSITASGFRGIGPKVTLPLAPGPGLTLVIGRNGSGKSSFAESVEIALTATNARWRELPAAWREGWRNLHVDGPPMVSLAMQVEGEPGTTTVRRTWTGAKVEESSCEVHRPGAGTCELSAVGWNDDLVTYRPFLSYSELGKILTGGPKELHDAIAGILGLERLTAAEARLGAVRKDMEAAAKAVKNELAEIASELERSDDPRAAAARSALSGRRPDLDALAELAAVGSGTDPDLTALRRAAELHGPDADHVADAARRLRDATAKLRSVEGTASEEALRLADLLARALDHAGRHGAASPCPVCGAPGALDDEWTRTTRAEVARLREEAAKADEARAALDRSVEQARSLITPAPAGLDEASASAWDAWSAGRGIGDPGALADHLERAGRDLREACDKARSRAAARLAEVEDRWRPLALRLAAWIPRARSAAESDGTLRSVKAARTWLTGAANALRNEELRPMAERSTAIWNLLRHESNVTLGPITLAGTGNMKKVLLDVQVDGTDTSALGVMSQGELHSLALALFLPRVLEPRTPFGFVVIDDPVQSMDPAKVDGLAQVLSEAARHRQVVVLTHDTRLREAVARLQLPASVIEVTRQERSVVSVRRVEDEVTRALADARAVAASLDLPFQAAVPVVAGLCRTALEAACLEVLRRKRLGAGAPYAEVEALARSARTLADMMSLAAFEEIRPRAAVRAHLGRHGQWAQDAFDLCNRGVHGGALSGDLGSSVDKVDRLVRAVRNGW